MALENGFGEALEHYAGVLERGEEDPGVLEDYLVRKRVGFKVGMWTGVMRMVKHKVLAHYLKQVPGWQSDNVLDQLWELGYNPAHNELPN